MSKKKDETKSTDIYELLLGASKQKKKETRNELLKSLGVKEFFEEGKVKIDMKTCKGVECKVCIKECPTNALFWKQGEVGITEELCVYCASCVFNCMVDNCIQVTRKRQGGETERFSNATQVCALLERLNARNRAKVLESAFPEGGETYLKRYRKRFFFDEEQK